MRPRAQADVRYITELRDATDLLQEPSLRTVWEQRLQSTSQINALYASPAWVSHLIHSRAGNGSVWLVKDSAGELVGLVPLWYDSFALAYEAYSRQLLHRRLQVWHLLGNVPALPAEAGVHEQLLGAIMTANPDCDGIYADTVPTDSYFWAVLRESSAVRRNLLVHVVNGPRPWYLLELRASFEEYLSTMSGKSRSTVRRRVRRLRDAGHGTLELDRVERSEQVERFLRDAARVSRTTWQHRVLGVRVRDNHVTQAAFADHADRGILRCYLLRCGADPVAFAIGYQFGGVYHSAELGFDPAYSRYSPGTVLLMLLIEDLHTHHAPAVLNFGLGDATYKRRFSTMRGEDVSCLILNRTIRNRFTVCGHAAFRGAIQTARKLLRREVPD